MNVYSGLMNAENIRMLNMRWERRYKNSFAMKNRKRMRGEKEWDINEIIVLITA